MLKIVKSAVNKPIIKSEFGSYMIKPDLAQSVKIQK